MAPFISQTDLTPNGFPILESKKQGNKILLLSPPSLSSHPEKLDAILAAYEGNTTSIQMLDRLAAKLVNLPLSSYDVAIILSDPDGTRNESSKLLDRNVLSSVVASLKAGGQLSSQDGSFASVTDGEERREAILAGLLHDSSTGLVKPDHNSTQAVPLRLGNRKKKAAAPVSSQDIEMKRSALPYSAASGDIQNTSRPVGVGIVDFSDDLSTPTTDDLSDNDLIDEDTLLDEDDLATPIAQPPECRPNAGKRRRACKDCTCGLKEKIEAEDVQKRSNADSALKTMKFGLDDLAEVDFTVEGKVGSCGNCSLGDAFRCDGCPYIGMPAFKPGEEVRLLNNDVQL
ncbi:MAG: hypothetical protein M1825_000821 [Sarcosagium campestre]|nr:MAG: hypothetical protein M1825_000821 [Sarcosagium campestre]